MIANQKPAPDFTLPDLDGQQHTLSEYRGRLVVLNFWSAECPWAKRADEVLQSWLTEWGEAVALLSIASNANEPLDQLISAAAERRLPLVLHDAEQQVADLYQAETTPHIYLIDGEGILRYQGAFDDVTFRQRQPTQNYLHQAVAALLAGADPDPDQIAPYGCTIMRHHLG